MDIVGLDMLINPSMSGDTSLPNMDTIDLPNFTDDTPGPNIMPNLIQLEQLRPGMVFRI